MFADIRKEILNTNSPAEITYYSVPPDWMRVVETEWREQNLVADRQLRNLKMFTNVGQYSAILDDVANLNSARTVRCTVWELTQNPRPLYYARQPIPAIVCDLRLVRVTSATLWTT
jgi:hypothetical protein